MAVAPATTAPLTGWPNPGRNLARRVPPRPHRARFIPLHAPVPLLPRPRHCILPVSHWFRSPYHSAAARALDARQAEGAPLPPLLAAPFVIADNMETSVGVTSAGLSFLDEWEAGVDGPLVEAAQAAGGLLVGKAVLSELSFATTGVNPTFGTPRNVSRSHACLALPRELGL